MNIRLLNQSELRKLAGIENGSMLNRNHFILKIIDFECSVESASSQIGLIPTSCGFKGEQYFIGPKKDVLRTREYNFWEYEWKIDSIEPLVDLLDNFFSEIIKPNLEGIKEASTICKQTRLQIIQYYCNGFNPGFSLSKEHIKILAQLSADIDLDIYCLSQE